MFNCKLFLVDNPDTVFYSIDAERKTAKVKAVKKLLITIARAITDSPKDYYFKLANKR